MTTQAEHAKLLCPVMTEFVAASLNGKPYCATDQCALWRWTGDGTERSEWVSYEDGRALEAQDWRHVCNNGRNAHRYERPYPIGQRLGICALAKCQ